MFRVRCLNIFGLVLLLFIMACSDSKIESNGMRTPEQVPEYTDDQVIVSEDGKTITKNGRGDVSSNPKGALKSWQKKS